jgi:hypothetical protein
LGTGTVGVEQLFSTTACIMQSSPPSDAECLGL